MTPFNRGDAAYDRSAKEVAAWEAQHPRRPGSPSWWWAVAIGAVLSLWVLAVGAAARMVWEMVG
jgi:hypothetical protein